MGLIDFYLFLWLYTSDYLNMASDLHASSVLTAVVLTIFSSVDLRIFCRSHCVCWYTNLEMCLLLFLLRTCDIPFLALPPVIALNLCIPFDIFPTRYNVTQFIYFWKTALHVSGGVSIHHQERTLYLQYLVLVKPLLLPAAIAGGSSNGLTSTRYCKYSVRSWWWVATPPETCRAVFQK